MILVLLFLLARPAWQVNDDPRTAEIRTLRAKVRALSDALSQTAGALSVCTSLTQKQKREAVDEAWRIRDENKL